MALDLSYWLQPGLDTPHAYGLFFLLGSFTVASLSDLRRMSAQSEFLHVWVLAAVALAAFAPQRQTAPAHAGWIAALACLGTLALILVAALMATAFAPALPPLIRDGAWTGLNQALAFLAFGELGLGIALALLCAGRRDPLFRWLALALTGLLKTLLFEVTPNLFPDRNESALQKSAL